MISYWPSGRMDTLSISREYSQEKARIGSLVERYGHSGIPPTAPGIILRPEPFSRIDLNSNTEALKKEGSPIGTAETIQVKEAATTRTITQPSDGPSILPSPPISSPIRPFVAIGSPSSKSSGRVTLRLLLEQKHAGALIGRGGRMVAEIREKTGVIRATVSANIPGAVDRIFTAVGTPSQLANAYVCIARLIAGAEVEEDSDSNMNPETWSIRLLIPNGMMGSIIGKGGSKLRDIFSRTGAKLSPLEGIFPESTERSLTVLGNTESLSGAIQQVVNS